MIKLFKIIIYTAIIVFLLSPFLVTFPLEVIDEQEYISDFNIDNGDFLEIDGYTTYYLDYDGENDETILLVHGFGGSATNWIPVMEELNNEGYRVVALDLKGFGLSDKDLEQDFSHNGQVKFLNSFINKLELKNITLVGHSMGGNIATMYVQKYPEKIDNLVLVSAAIVQKGDIEPVRSHGIKVLDFPLIKNYASVVFNLLLNQERMDSILGDALYELKSSDVPEPIFINPTSFKNWDYALIKISIVSGSNYLEESLSTINTPTLIVWGDKDTWVELSKAEYLDTKIEDSRLEIMEDVAHLPMIENPSEFNNILIDFLED